MDINTEELVMSQRWETIELSNAIELPLHEIEAAPAGFIYILPDQKWFTVRELFQDILQATY